MAVSAVPRRSSQLPLFARPQCLLTRIGQICRQMSNAGATGVRLLAQLLRQNREEEEAVATKILRRRTVSDKIKPHQRSTAISGKCATPTASGRSGFARSSVRLLPQMTQYWPGSCSCLSHEDRVVEGSIHRGERHAAIYRQVCQPDPGDYDETQPSFWYSAGFYSGATNFGWWDANVRSFVSTGMEQYLLQNKILFKDYYQHVKTLSQTAEGTPP